MDPKEIAASLAPTLRQQQSVPAIPQQTLADSLQALNKDLMNPDNPKKLRKFVVDALQGTARGLVGLGNDLLGRKPSSLPENAPRLEKIVYQTIFGNTENPSASKEGAEFLKGFGVNTQTAEKYGTVVGFPLAILSVLPIGGKSRNALEKLVPTIAKETNPQVILRALDNATQRIAPEALRTAATDLAKITKPAEVQSYIKEFLTKNGGTAYSHTPEAALKGIKIADETASKLVDNSADPILARKIQQDVNMYRAYAENTPNLSESTLNKILADSEDALARLKSITADTEDTVKRAVQVVDDAARESQRVLGESIGFKADVVAGRSSFDPIAARAALAQTGRNTMSELQSLEKMAAEATAHEKGIAPETMQSFAGDANLVEMADKAEMARQYRAMLEDAVANHPAAGLMKFTDRSATLGDSVPQLGELKKNPGLGAKGQKLKDTRSLFGTRGDTMVSEISSGAYKTIDEANAGLEDLYKLKKDAEAARAAHIQLTKDLANESRITKATSAPIQETQMTSEQQLVGQKERGFSETVRGSGGTNPEVAAKVASYYDPITNKDTLAEATAILAKGDDIAEAAVRDIKEPTALSNAVAQLLVEKYQTLGRIEAAVSLVKDIAAKATTQGQAIQTLSLWNRLTPGGILRYAEKELVAAGKKLEPALAKKLVDSATKLKEMDAGWEKSFETAKMLRLISDELPVSKGKKIALTQTMLLLLNPKTWIRNLIGNAGFVALENVADIPAAMLDSAMSIVNGVRTKVPPSILEQSRGFLRGGKQAWKEALAGVNTTGVKSQFDIPPAPVFKGRVGKAAETLLNIELRVPDRAFYQAAYDGSIYQQMKAANLTAHKIGAAPITEPTPAMIEIAHHDGLYRTFQDDSVIAKVFVGIKRAMNVDQDFGMGDILLKFPKTPGNLLARGIDYSPAGFVKMVYEASRPLPIMGGHKFNQKAFVEHFGRAVVGTAGLVGTGVLLHRLGILSGKSNDNKDVRDAKSGVGFGDYKINVSALKRFAFSGMDASAAKPQKGDTLITYDWFQPAAMPIALGANISQNHGINKGSISGEIWEAIGQGTDSLTQTQMFSNFNQAASDYVHSNYSVGTMLTKLGARVPASFIPTLSNQIRTLKDNDQRNTYSNDAIQYMFNTVKNKIPGASETLPQSLSPYGDVKEKYQDNTNNLFNVLFNPMFISKYKDDPAINMVLDIFKQTGDSSAVPDSRKYIQKVNGKNMTLGPNQYFQLSKFVGEKTRFYLESFAADPDFQALSDQDKADYIAAVLKDISAYGKIIILGDRPTRVSGRVQQMISQDYGS